MEPKDLELVSRYRDGEQRAFELLVKRYQRKVYSIAFGVLRNPLFTFARSISNAFSIVPGSNVLEHGHPDQWEISTSAW